MFQISEEGEQKNNNNLKQNNQEDNKYSNNDIKRIIQDISNYILSNGQFNIDPEIKNKYKHIICYYSQYPYINASQYQFYQQYINPRKIKFGKTLAMQQIIDEKRIPDWKYYHHPLITDDYKMTVAMYLVSHKIIPPLEWVHDPNFQDMSFMCVIDYLRENNLFIPNEWYDNTMDEIDKNPEFIQQAIYSQIPKKQSGIDARYQNCDGWTVAMILSYNKISVPKEWWHDPKLQNPNTLNTVAMILAQQGINPPQQWYHNKYLRNKKKQTVYMLLRQSLVKNISKYWKYPSINDEDDNSQAIIKAKRGEIPERKVYDDPYQENILHQTVAIVLALQNIEIPDEWLYNPEYRLTNNQTTAIYLASKGKIPSQYWYHDPLLQDNDQMTVSLHLAKNGILPPEQWCHDSNVRDNQGNTVAYYLKSNKLPIPDEWQDNSMKNVSKQPKFVQQALHGEIPEKSKDINYDYDCGYGWTIAMILALQNKDIPKEWCHDPLLRNNRHETVKNILQKNKINIPKGWEYPSVNNKYDDSPAMMQAKKGKVPNNSNYHNPLQQNKNQQTVAIILASQGMIPPFRWSHDKNIRDINGKTVENYLLENNQKVPNYWRIQDNYDNPKKYKYNDQDDYNNSFSEYTNDLIEYDGEGITKAMIMAKQGRIPYIQYYHKPEIQDSNGYTVAMYLAEKGINIPNEWKHDKLLTNNDGSTVAMCYASKGYIPHQEWKHKSSLQNNMGNTVAILLAYNGKDIPEQWRHNPNIKNIQGQTVAYYLKQQKIPLLNEWYDDNMNNVPKNPEFINQAIHGIIPSKPNNIQSNYQNIDNWTVAMILARLGEDIPEEWHHNKYLRNNKGQTVQMILKQNNINIPVQWQYNDQLDKYYKFYVIDQSIIITPEFNDNKDRITYAIFLAQQGIIPPQEWCHDKYLTDNKGKTVEYYLLKNNIEVPQQWRIQEDYNNPRKYEDNCESVTKAIIMAKQGRIPYQEYIHKHEIQDDNKNTVAILLAQNGKDIPEEWNHNKYIRNYDGKTVQMILQEKHIQVPEYWQYPSQYDDIGTPAIQQARNGQIPSNENYHEPWISTKNGDTVAIYLIQNNIEVPEEWLYEHEYRLYNGQTTAMKLAEYGIDIPEYWEHDSLLTDEDKKTVEDYLLENKKEVPEQWRIQDNYNNPQQDKNAKTKAIIMAEQGRIPYKEYQHKPEIQDEFGNTVAIYLLQHNISIPQQWLYDPLYKLDNDQTTAMILAEYDIIPPQQLRHDKLLTNKYGKTVAIILSSKGIIPDDYWMHDINIQDKHGNSIRSNLIKRNYIYHNEKFKYNVQTETKQTMCIICLIDKEQEFIKTPCKHNICLECFKQLVINKQQRRCPYCRQENWFTPIDREQYQQYLNQINHIQNN